MQVARPPRWAGLLDRQYRQSNDQGEAMIGETQQRTEQQTVWVNAYSIDRCYGGPEEGGWWYDWCQCIASCPVPESAAEQVEQLMRSTIGWESEPDRQSVIGGSDFAVYVEDERAESESTERPIYC